MSRFKFANPEYLYLLLLVLVLVGIFVAMRIIRKRNIEKFGNPDMLKNLMPDVSIYRPYIKFCILLTVIVLIIFMMARPQFGSKRETVKQQGIEVMIALDVSNSMLADDIAPNRLEKAKRILSQLVDGMTNDKIGLVVFAGDAFIQLPITSDYVSAKMFMSSITPNLVARQGTAIGAAIDLSVRSFPSEKEGVSRAIIVITDGENHEDDAVGAARAAAEKGIVVHVIGMGTTSGVPIPIPGTSNFMKDRQGNIVITKLNEQMCQEIAQAGNGIYVRADNTNTALKIITDELRKIKTSETEVKVYSDYNEQFQTLAWIALILLIIEFFILERKNKVFSKFRLFD